MNTQKKTYKAAAALAIVMLVSSALPAFAKEKEKDEKHKIPPGQLKKEIRQDLRESYLDFLRFYFANFRRSDDDWRRGTSTRSDTVAPVISNLRVKAINKKNATVTWTTNERSDSQVFVSSTTPVNTTQVAKSTGNNGLVTEHRIQINKLKANTTYYVVVRSRDRAGNVVTSDTISFNTDPTKADTTAPAISNIVGTVSSTTININWKTNENTSSKVFYSTASNIDINSSSTAFVEKSALTKDHSLVIPNLASSTNYYLVIESRDASGNKTNSSVILFTTASVTAPADTTAPVVSNVYGITGGKTLSVNWLTNESASSKVYYSTTSPIDVSATSTASVSDAAFVTSHSILIGDLSTSTKYYFVVESKDNAGNTARSSQFYAITSSN